MDFCSWVMFFYVVGIISFGVVVGGFYVRDFNISRASASSTARFSIVVSCSICSPFALCCSPMITISVYASGCC